MSLSPFRTLNRTPNPERPNMEQEAVKGDIEIIELQNPGSELIPKSWMEIDKLSTKIVDDNITSAKAQATAASAGGGPRTRHVTRTRRQRRRRRRRRPSKRTRRVRRTTRRRRRPSKRVRRTRCVTRRRPSRRTSRKIRTKKVRSGGRPSRRCQSGGQMVENDVNVQLTMKSGLDDVSRIKSDLNARTLENYHRFTT